MLLLISVRTWPTAKRLAAGGVPPDLETQALRGLTVYQTACAVLMVAVVVMQQVPADRNDASGVVAASGAAVLAAALWNEVPIDRSHSNNAGTMSAADRSTLFGYYAAMTDVAARPNLLAAFFAIGTTMVALATQVAGGIRGHSPLPSAALFFAFSRWPAR